IGVHAGEAIETDEGLVGSAVNIAARLSALARPGEILVSETVRTLTRSVVTVGFVDRGRQRLKGVGEPMTVFPVVPKPSVPPPSPGRRITKPVLAAAGVLALLLTLGAVYALSSNMVPAVAQPPKTSPSAAPPTASVPVHPSAVAPSATATGPVASP